MTDRKKIIRTATVPLSLDLFCRGLLRDLSSRYEIIALSSPQPELDSIRRREKVRTISVPMARKIAPFSDLKSLFELIRVFRKERPDMVHSITPKAGLLSMMAARWTRVPVRIHTFTGLIFPYEKGWKRRLLMTTDRLTASCATHVIPEGVGIRDDLIRFKITRKPLRVLGNGNVRGIDLSHYVRTEKLGRSAADLRNCYNIPDDGFAFIFVGRLDRDKGIDELVQAFRMLAKDEPKVHLSKGSPSWTRRRKSSPGTTISIFPTAGRPMSGPGTPPPTPWSTRAAAKASRTWSSRPARWDSRPS